MELGPFFQSNLDAMRATHPEQAKTLADVAPKLHGRLYPVRPKTEAYLDVDAPSPMGSSQRLYGNQSPHDVLAAWVQETRITEHALDSVVVIGGGLGDHIEVLRKHLRSHAVLAWVEPDALLFMTAFANRDLRGVLEDPRVHLFIGSPAMKAVDSIGNELSWNRFLVLSSATVIHPMIQRGNPTFVENFLKRWTDSLERETLYRRARVQSGEPVVMNTLANSGAIVTHPGIKRLFHHWGSVPAALVAAGPSLNDSVDALREYRDSMLIACVNTAYPVLRRAGIEPDLVITMDHQERNRKSFEGEAPAPHTWLVADPRIHPAIPEAFGERVFVASWRTTTETLGAPAPLHAVPVPERSGNSIYDWLQKALERKGDIFGPGSVAVAGFHVLARMGCEPIVLVGQDLAFNEDQAYASGTIFDDKSLPRDQKGTHRVAGVDGGDVSTSETLYLYRQLLEHEIKRFGITVYNASRGAVIAGSVNARMENILPELPPMPFRVSSMLQSFGESYSPPTTLRVLREHLVDGQRAVEQLRDDVLEQLREVPSDLDAVESMQSLQSLEKTLGTILGGFRETHPFAFMLLNELLQEAHFDFDDSQWKMQVLESPREKAIENIRRSTRVMDAVVTQSEFLIQVLQKKINQLSRS